MDLSWGWSFVEELGNLERARQINILLHALMTMCFFFLALVFGNVRVTFAVGFSLFRIVRDEQAMLLISNLTRHRG